MDEQLLDYAKQLAAGGYDRRVFPSHTTTGEPMFAAEAFGFPNCIGQGATVDQALEDLQFALEDYIYFLLRDDIPVPKPQDRSSTGDFGFSDLQITAVYYSDEASDTSTPKQRASSTTQNLEFVPHS